MKKKNYDFIIVSGAIYYDKVFFFLKNTWQQNASAKMSDSNFWFGLLNGISPYGLFKSEIWLICKCLIIIITIFGLVYLFNINSLWVI